MTDDQRSPDNPFELSPQEISRASQLADAIMDLCKQVGPINIAAHALACALGGMTVNIALSCRDQGDTPAQAHETIAEVRRRMDAFAVLVSLDMFHRGTVSMMDATEGRQ